MHRSIDIEGVTRIECATLKTEADMFLYEIYYINLLKPPLNRDDKARDELTERLPDLDFKEYRCHLFEKWVKQIAVKNLIEAEKQAKKLEWQDEKRAARKSVMANDKGEEKP
jgi:hypothetical protein